MFNQLREKLYWRYKTWEISACKYTEKGIKNGAFLTSSPFHFLNAVIDSIDINGSSLPLQILRAGSYLLSLIFGLSLIHISEPTRPY